MASTTAFPCSRNKLERVVDVDQLEKLSCVGTGPLVRQAPVRLDNSALHGKDFKIPASSQMCASWFCVRKAALRTFRRSEMGIDVLPARKGSLAMGCYPAVGRFAVGQEGYK
uniref:Uncharacterized protein n=1 Tax=Fusarium oxysporum (strain Fo5176) TaxID=660025 RepID=A0A0D2XT85_FUSOF